MLSRAMFAHTQQKPIHGHTFIFHANSHFCDAAGKFSIFATPQTVSFFSLVFHLEMRVYTKNKPIRDYGRSFFVRRYNNKDIIVCPSPARRRFSITRFPISISFMRRLDRFIWIILFGSFYLDHFIWIILFG